MDINKKIRISFLIRALLTTLVLVAPLPFFTNIVKEIPLVSLILAEISLIFLVVLASFPKASIREILKIGSQYLFFIGFVFAILSFLPFESQYKLFHFGDLGGMIPNLVAVNIIGLIVLNTLAFLFFGLELNRKEPTRRFKSAEERKMASLVKLSEDREETEFKKELKKEVNSLFEIYLKDYELGALENNEKLENIEKALLENIGENITGAMCVDNEGNVLHNSVFHWSGYPKEKLLDCFNENNKSSIELGTGALCQMLYKDSNHWYIIAKYRGNFLILQSEAPSPGNLLETCFRVFRTLRAI
jgi:hypothetical protein